MRVEVAEYDRNRADEATTQELGRRIAVGALRYFLVRFNRNTVIAFDMDDALSFEGETGPYIQYAAVRAYRGSVAIEEYLDAVRSVLATLASAVTRQMT